MRKREETEPAGVRLAAPPEEGRAPIVTTPATPGPPMVLRPVRHRRAALSLQTRAAVVIALGILAISGYVAR